MNTISHFILAVLAQVSLITAAALILMGFARRRSAFRHSAGVIGIALSISSPLLVLGLPRPGWLPPNRPLTTASAPSQVPRAPVISAPVLAKSPVFDPDGDVPLPDNSPPEQQSERLATVPDSELQSPGEAPVVNSVVPPAPIVEPDSRPELKPVATSATAHADGGGSLPLLSAAFVALGCVWCCGAMIAVVRDWRRWRELKSIVRSCIPATPQQTDQVALDVCATLGLQKLPPISVSEMTPLPFVFGVANPIVILPREIVESASTERLREILIHECAHIIRRDPWVLMLQRLSAVLFWLHPAVHWVNRQIARAREELCDNFVIKSGNAAEYSETLLKLALFCDSKRLAPAALGLLSPRWTLEQRIGGLLDPARDMATRARRGTSAMLVITLGSLSLISGGIGLLATGVSADSKPREEISQTKKTDIRGRCVDQDQKPLANIVVRLYQNRLRPGSPLEHNADPVKVLAENKSDPNGNFAFVGVEIPVSGPGFEYMQFPLVAAMAEGRASASSLDSLESLEAQAASQDSDQALVLSSEPQKLSGIVTDANGRSVSGATVRALPLLGGMPIPGMWTSVTDREGRYSINDLNRWAVKPPEEHLDSQGRPDYTVSYPEIHLVVEHPDYVIAYSSTKAVPNEVNISLKPTAIIEGQVVDGVTGKSAGSVVVRAQGIAYDVYAQTKTDQNGRYRLLLTKDSYNVWVEAEDRVAIVRKAIDAVPGKPATKLDFRLTSGAIIAGVVIDDATNLPLAGAMDKPTYVAHYGPACVKTQPQTVAVGQPGVSVGVQQETRVHPNGTFRLRVAPGRNCVFFLQNFGEEEQASQIVSIEEGQERKIELRVKLETRQQPGLAEGPDLAEGEVHFSTSPRKKEFHDDEIDADIEEFTLLRREIRTADAAARSGKPAPASLRLPSRKRRDSAVNRLLNRFERKAAAHPFSSAWLGTIKQIADLGPAAVPDLIEELDATDDLYMLQMLGFTLRAINDRRAVPALIRAIPKTLPPPPPAETVPFDIETYRHPATSDIMIQVVDRELLAFVQLNELRPGGDGCFMYLTPVHEICGALARLTGAQNGEQELFEAVEDELTSPAQMQRKQKLFQRVARKWADWWEQHKDDKVAVRQEFADETEAIQKIQQAGGKIQRDTTRPGRPVSHVDFKECGFEVLELVKDLRGLRSLRHWGAYPRDLQLGNVEALSNLKGLTELWLLNITVTDDGLKAIGKLHNLNDLRIRHEGSDGLGFEELHELTQLQVMHLSGVTNQDLKEISRHQTLTELELSGRIDDQGIRELAPLINLKKLDLVGNNITDAGLMALKPLQNLTSLEIISRTITDAGLEGLSQLTRLNRLNLHHSSIMGEGFHHLADLEDLTFLDLHGCPVNDEGLKQIAKLTSVKFLTLSDTRITDDGLKELAKLKNLESLEIKETEVTSKGVKDLKAALPNASITD